MGRRFFEGQRDMNGFGGAARIQRRVVWALMLRETKTLFGKHKLGYLWVIIQAGFTIGIFWVLREITGFSSPPGFSTPAFLVGGFIPFYIFREVISGAVSAVPGNRALLAYPQVFPIDILVARAVLKGAVYLCVMVILLAIARALGYEVPLRNPAAILLALTLSLVLGFGVGSLCSALNLVWHTTERIVPMILRLMFYTSGLFFSVESAPGRIREILFYNPVSHLIELLRCGMTGYESTFVYMPYVIGCILVTLSLGLLLERYSRRYMDEST
jgi:capsular polysaccharide transport system permease protein